MRYKRLKQEREGKSGWTGWIQPIKRGYIMACCDCGLCHRLDFRVHRGRAQFRAQRAPRYTSRERARMLKTKRGLLRSTSTRSATK